MKDTLSIRLLYFCITESFFKTRDQLIVSTLHFLFSIRV